jgi:AcrR family transcriptional regulator
MANTVPKRSGECKAMPEPAGEMPPRPWTRAERGTPRRVLTRELIVSTALRVLDAEGLDAVSMRRVAQELGTGAASLYVHVGSKEDLLSLMHDAVAGEVEVPEPDPERWQEQVKEVARSMHAAYRRHNDISRVSLGVIPTGEQVLRVAEGLLAIMRAGGVPDQQAGWMLDRLAQYVDADAYEGALVELRLRGDAEAFERELGQIGAYFAALPRDRFPHLTSMVATLMTGGGEERFEFGLALLVDGLAEQTRRARSGDAG